MLLSEGSNCIINCACASFGYIEETRTSPFHPAYPSARFTIPLYVPCVICPPHPFMKIIPSKKTHGTWATINFIAHTLHRYRDSRRLHPTIIVLLCNVTPIIFIAEDSFRFPVCTLMRQTWRFKFPNDHLGGYILCAQRAKSVLFSSNSPLILRWCTFPNNHGGQYFKQ